MKVYNALHNKPKVAVHLGQYADRSQKEEVYNAHHIPPTCFGHSCGHLQGAACPYPL
jgi:peptide deformylase